MATSQEYISAKDAAQRHGLSFCWVKRLAQHGKIPGAFKLSPRAWAIPASWTPQRQRNRTAKTSANGD